MTTIRMTLVASGILALVSPDYAKPAEKRNPAELAAQIDKKLMDIWTDAGVAANAQSTDAVFARRLYLDLVGRIPTVAESREFIDDKVPRKREKLIDTLLSSGGHFRHAATQWRRVWIPQADTPRFANLSDGFEDWLAQKLADNTKYDEFVRTLITADKRAPAGRRVNQFGAPRGTVEQSFIIASESNPENLAANSARAFLGVNLDCAQCHNHPFAKWTRDQFWEMAAFFTSPSAEGEGAAKFQIAIPDTKKTVEAAFLDESPLKWPGELSAKVGPDVLAEWMTSPKNPFFARNAVNRIWAELFGLGLSEPLDDLGGENEPFHPTLLDFLANEFADSHFDLKYFTKALVMTKAYQLSSATKAGESPSDPRMFARMPVRGLTGEQLHDSIRVAAGLPVRRDDLNPNAARERKQFATMFYTQRAATSQRSMVQSLALMNGTITAEVTDVYKTPTLGAVANAPFLDTDGKIEALFLAALGRKPTDKELASIRKYVETGGSGLNRDHALADVFWALLNGSEFNTNH